MDNATLKTKLIERIIKIDDPVLLDCLHALLSTSNKNLMLFLTAFQEKIKTSGLNEQEDFSTYIKEWVKNM